MPTPLPPLAGLATFTTAQKTGLAVHDSVDRLKRYHYALQRLFAVFNTRLTAEPQYELKMAFSYHAYLCSQHIDTIRDRVAEMRHPPLGLDKIPNPHLQTFFDEILHAPTTAELLTGIYKHALPALLDAVGQHLAETNPLADAPTVRILDHLKTELTTALDYGQQALACYASEQSDLGTALPTWSALLTNLLAAAGSLSGTTTPPGSPEITPIHSTSPIPYQRLRSPARDQRFPDPYNMGVHAEQFLYNKDYPADAKTLMLYYKRLREIDVPEMMASILVEATDKPWPFHRDMARQLWDEARHAMMGEVGFHKLGIDWPSLVPVNFTWSKNLNEQLTPEERHAVLWYIEQGLMDKTGKRYEWEVGKQAGDPLSELYQDYDWADEVLHARIGRVHYVDHFGSIEEASKFGTETWSKVVSNWQKMKDDGLTAHRNWWPDLYTEYCRLNNTSADPAALAFDESYADTRADLQRIAASG